MNTRQLTQGLLPTVEFERQHTFKTYRQFPELRVSVQELGNLRLTRDTIANPLSQSRGISRQISRKSTHRLEELSKSSMTDVTSVMDDFRKILLENRHKNPMSLSQGSLSSATFISKEDAEVAGLSFADAADHKLTKMSITFDAQSSNNHLQGFAGARLTKKEFDILLRRCLNINLRKAEFDALFEKMDADGSMLIDGVEFVRYFFHLGNEARWKMLIDTKEVQHRKVLALKKRRLEEEQKIKEWEATQIGVFNDADFESAMRKLQDAAFQWDPSNNLQALFIQGFEAFLSPYQFKQQIEKSFSVRLSGGEIGSLISHLSTGDGEYCIDGYMFVKKFYALHKDAWLKHKQDQLKFSDEKQRVLNMAQRTDYLPKELGR